jgi:hypothetical protein
MLRSREGSKYRMHPYYKLQGLEPSFVLRGRITTRCAFVRLQKWEKGRAI